MRNINHMKRKQILKYSDCNVGNSLDYDLLILRFFKVSGEDLVEKTAFSFLVN
jgi:hypothetical protein